MSSTAEALLGSLGIDDVLTDIVADIKISWKEILYMSLIALGDLTGCLHNVSKILEFLTPRLG